MTEDARNSCDLACTGDDAAKPNAPRPFSPAEYDLLTFAIRWLPYGGGPDDEVLINFGLTPQDYRQRIRDLVACHRGQIHPSTAERLVECSAEVEGSPSRQAFHLGQVAGA
jgi:hypothetical protein